MKCTLMLFAAFYILEMKWQWHFDSWCYLSRIITKLSRVAPFSHHKWSKTIIFCHRARIGIRKMVEETAHDYTNYLDQLNFSKEVISHESNDLLCIYLYPPIASRSSLLINFLTIDRADLHKYRRNINANGWIWQFNFNREYNVRFKEPLEPTIFHFHNSQIKNISASTPIPNIAECEAGFKKYFDNIDKLQLVINRINSDLTAMEESVAKAEEELGYNESGIKGFLKPFLDKVVKTDRSKSDADSNSVNESPTFVPTNVFKASEYFPSSGQSNETKSAE